MLRQLIQGTPAACEALLVSTLHSRSRRPPSSLLRPHGGELDGEVALGVVLADPSGEITALQQAARRYPPPLRQALVAGLWEASFDIDIARKAVTRGDTAYVAGCLFRVVKMCAHALHGHAGHWLINEKNAVASAGRLPGAPAGFAVRAQSVLAHLGSTPSELSSAIDSASDLLADTTNVCRPSR